MKIWVSEYELTPRWKANAVGLRRGALLKIEDPECGVGFADCHPWVELGDMPLPKQLNLLLRGRMTSLTERSLFFARIDAAARSQGRWLFEGATIPQSHWLVPGIGPDFLPCVEEGIEAGFDTFKFKIGAEAETAPSFLNAVVQGSQHHPLRLRLDCNAQQTSESLKAFISRLNVDVRRSIEFIEDPLPYDVDRWRSLSAELDIAFARDRGSNPAEMSDCDISIIKPAIQNPVPMVTVALKLHKKIAVTSYLDHPIGQATAAYAAALAYKHAPEATLKCGLISHTVYASNSFSARFAIDDERLTLPAGTGFGFDEELAALEWTRLV